MKGRAFPLFESGHILRSEMLEVIADYSFKFSELLHLGYSNGILSGCQLTTTADSIILNPGIICFESKLYIIKHPLFIKYFPTDTICTLWMQFFDEVRADNFIYHDIELLLSDNIGPQDDKLELCHFRLQQGAELRCQYVDFSDRNTDFDTLNTINTPYASQGDHTLSPAITQAFAREMIDLSTESLIDISFCLSALNANAPLSHEAISAYIRLHTHDMRLDSNVSLFKGLNEILIDAKKLEKRVRGKHTQPRRTIMVD